MPAIRHPLRASAEAAGLSDFLQPRAVWVKDIDIGQLKTLPTPVSERSSVIAARRESNPLTVGRPRRPEITAFSKRQTLDVTRRDIHGPEGRRAPAAAAHKNQLFAVRRKRRLIVVGRIVRQSLETGTIRLDEKRSADPARSEVKTMDDPSGDQTGS